MKKKTYIIKQSKIKVDRDLLEIEHVISSKNLDRYGTYIIPSGAQLENYLRNPKVLWYHNQDSAAEKIPIARAVKLTINEGDVIATTRFNPNDSFSVKVFNAYADGFLSAWSIGFMPKNYILVTEKNRDELNKKYNLNITKKGLEKDNKVFAWGTYVVNEWELLEYSAVPVGANQDALVITEEELDALVTRGLVNDKKDAKEFCDFVSCQKSLFTKEDLKKEEEGGKDFYKYIYTCPGCGAEKESDNELLLCEKCNISMRAKWTGKYINSLPDSAFAVIEPDYKSGKTEDKNARHLPHHDGSGDLGKAVSNVNIDMSHYKNARARANQVKPITESITTEELRAKAVAHLERHHKQLLKEGKVEKSVEELEAERIAKENADKKTEADKKVVSERLTKIEDSVSEASDENKKNIEEAATAILSISERLDKVEKVMAESKTAKEVSELKKTVEDFKKALEGVAKRLDVNSIEGLRKLEENGGESFLEGLYK